MLIAVLVIVGCGAVYFASQRMLKHACAQLRLEFREQVDALSRTLDARTVAQPNAVSPSASRAARSDEVTPETLASIGACVTALVGKEVHISSAQTLPRPTPVLNPWAGQGRITIQSSHDVRPVRNLAMAAPGPANQLLSKRSAA